VLEAQITRIKRRMAERFVDNEVGRMWKEEIGRNCDIAECDYSSNVNNEEDQESFTFMLYIYMLHVHVTVHRNRFLFK